jgi:hypothetical protein
MNKITKCDKQSSWLHRLVGLVRVYVRDDCPDMCQTRWWMALAYYRAMDRKRVMVAWPLHYVWRAALWLEWKWHAYRLKPSWIDRHVEESIKAHESRPRYFR